VTQSPGAPAADVAGSQLPLLLEAVVVARQNSWMQQGEVTSLTAFYG